MGSESVTNISPVVKAIVKIRRCNIAASGARRELKILLLNIRRRPRIVTFFTSMTPNSW